MIDWFRDLPGEVLGAAGAIAAGVVGALLGRADRRRHGLSVIRDQAETLRALKDSGMEVDGVQELQRSVEKNLKKYNDLSHRGEPGIHQAGWAGLMGIGTYATGMLSIFALAVPGLSSFVALSIALIGVSVVVYCAWYIRQRW